MNKRYIQKKIFYKWTIERKERKLSISLLIRLAWIEKFNSAIFQNGWYYEFSMVIEFLSFLFWIPLNENWIDLENQFQWKLSECLDNLLIKFNKKKK